MIFYKNEVQLVWLTVFFHFSLGYSITSSLMFLSIFLTLRRMLYFYVQTCDAHTFNGLDSTLVEKPLVWKFRNQSFLCQFCCSSHGACVLSAAWHPSVKPAQRLPPSPRIIQKCAQCSGRMFHIDGPLLSPQNSSTVMLWFLSHSFETVITGIFVLCNKQFCSIVRVLFF